MKKLLGFVVLSLSLIPTLAMSATLIEHLEGHCRLNKNFIYYENYDHLEGGIERYIIKKSDPRPDFTSEESFKSFSLLAKSLGEYNVPKNYEEEIIFNSDGSMTTTNLKTCKTVNTNWEFYGYRKVLIGDSYPKKFGIKIILGRARSSAGYIQFVGLADLGKFGCENDLNPACDESLGVKLIIGFRNLEK